MKIAFIHYSAPPVVGGVERVLAEQIRLLRGEKHFTLLACFEGGENLADSLIPLSRNASREELRTYLGAALADADCVLIHNVGTMPFSPALTGALQDLAALRPLTRWIHWTHDIALGNPDYPHIHPGCGHPCVLPCPDWEYVGISPLRVREVEKFFQMPCRWIPNGVDPAQTLQLSPHMASLAEQLGLWDADAVLLNPTRLLPRKNLLSGLDAVRDARSMGCDLKFLITGAADPHHSLHREYADRVESVAAEAPLRGHVHLMSKILRVGPVELCDLYKIADALLLTSSREGFGLPPLEAGVFGKRVFCPDLEPLNSLPGVTVFPANVSATGLAHFLIHQLHASEAISGRRKTLRNYRWLSIYRNHLKPLLEQPHAPRP